MFRTIFLKKSGKTHFRVRDFLLTGLVILGMAYWHYGLFPGTLQEKPKAYLKEITGRDIDFQRIRYLAGP